MKRVVLGTAGHIDHGKSTLVKALTGIDPDRLKEEKEKGITIELGYSYIFYEPDVVVGIVDVPGHEKFIKTMVSGATGIDMVLLVVSADEGIMAQTREHFEICKFLGLKEGLVAITKVDTVDEELVELVEEEVKELVKGTFLEGKPIVKVDSVSGRGIPELKKAIKEVAMLVPEKPPTRPFRLYADRVFTMRGFGTVITGTAISGKVSVGDELEVFPIGEKVKVRGIQTYGMKVESAYAGMRVAMNLSGVTKERLDRGFCFASKNSFVQTDTVLATLTVSELTDHKIKNDGVYRFLAGSSISLARINMVEGNQLSPGETGFVRIKLDRPFVFAHGDRFIIRGSGTLQTYGGGTILDPLPPKIKRKRLFEYALSLTSSSMEEKILAMVEASPKGAPIKEIARKMGISEKEMDTILKDLSKSKKVVVAGRTAYEISHYNQLKERMLKLLDEFHRKNPFKPGMSKEEVRSRIGAGEEIFALLLEEMASKGSVDTKDDYLFLKGFTPGAPEGKSELVEKIKKKFSKTGLTPPTAKEIIREFGEDAKDILEFLESEGFLLKVTPEIYVEKKAFQGFLESIKTVAGENGFTLQDAKKETNLTRKYLVPYLELLDRMGITFRAGDRRFFRS